MHEQSDKWKVSKVKNGHCFLIRYITFPFVFIWRFVWTQLQCWNLLYLCHKDLTNVYGCMLALCRVSALKHERKWGWGRMCFKAVTSSTVSMDCWHNKFQCHKCSTCHCRLVHKLTDLSHLREKGSVLSWSSPLRYVASGAHCSAPGEENKAPCAGRLSHCVSVLHIE